MLVTDNDFTGSGLSVYGSLQQLLALGHFRPGPQQSYLNVRKRVRPGMSLCKRVHFLYFGFPGDNKRPCDPTEKCDQKMTILDFILILQPLSCCAEYSRVHLLFFVSPAQREHLKGHIAAFSAKMSVSLGSATLCDRGG